ncbi:sensor histidine kinase [Streptomyces sp. SID13031]|uniref:histidine kinase n=1 Tax=Streptomyces sp. SID13031 TaxID=2706046 RepID=UPI0013CC78A5|nr:sensor histidine kinase [Streptomyces sp. SID13031]
MSGHSTPAVASAAGARSGGLRGVRPEVFDWVLGAVATALCAVDLFVLGRDDPWGIANRWVLVVIGLAPATLAVRRRWPFLPAPALALAAILAYPVAGRSWVLIAFLAVALCLLAATHPPLYAAAVGALAVALPTAVALINWFRLTTLAAKFPGIEWAGWSLPGYPQYRIPAFADPLEWSASVWLYPLLIGAWLLGVAWKHLDAGPTMLQAIQRFFTDPANRLWLDGLLAAALVAAMVYDITANRSLGTEWAWAGARQWLLLFACAAPASLTLRRVIPEIPCVVLGLAGLLSYPVTQTHFVLTPALAVALYSLGVWRPWPRSLAVAASGLAALPLLGWLIGGKPIVRLVTVIGNLDEEEPSMLRAWPVWLSAIMLAAWAVGLLVRLARENRLAAVRESELVKQNQQREQVQVLLEGRSQIARDLHDVVAHHVNLIVIQAETGPDLVQRDERDVLQGFQRIGDAGRKALGELDRMLSALRDAHGVPDPSLTPQPGLKDLQQLTDGLSEQGLPVSLELRGDLAQIPDGVQLTAYRLVQEALTNVVKHARASAVRVLVDVSSGGVGVWITDDGQGFDQNSPPDGRHGLTGMRERVRVHEGTLTISSHPGAGTAISAHLPYAEEQANA